MPCFFICSGYLFYRYTFSEPRKILVSVGNFFVVYLLFATLFIVMSMMFTTNNHNNIHSLFVCYTVKLVRIGICMFLECAI